MQILHDIWHWLEGHSHPLNILRVLIWVAIFAGLIRWWWQARKRSRKRTEDEEEQVIAEKFEKDENGLYPWEKNTDDSPEAVKKGAKRVNLDSMPQRGRWKL